MKRIRSFAGANVYSHRPAVVLDYDFGGIKKKKSSEVPGFNANLLELLPGLVEHFCNLGEPVGFIERLDRGMHFNHIAEHVTIELMALAGINAQRQKMCAGEVKDFSKTIIETTSQETTGYLLSFAAELVEAVSEGKMLNVEERIIEAKRMAVCAELGQNSMLIVQAAEKRGIPWSRQDESDLIQLGYGVNLHLVKSALTGGTSFIGAETASDKNLTKQRLYKFSVPVPDGKVALDEREAVESLKAIGAPVVVKPLDGRNGKGVSLNLSMPEEVVEAFRAAKKYSSKVLIEEMFEGKNYRVLIVGGKMIAASQRLFSSISGFGTNLSIGDTTRDVTDEVHQSVRNMCERAARIVGLDICGVDLVTEDISVPLPRKKAGIIKVVASPELRMQAFPNEGMPRDIGAAIIEMLYPHEKPAHIPIVSITGTNGKTSVTRMTAHILGGANLYVGMTTSTGIYLNGELIVKGDTTGPVSARTILGDSAVEAAVLETARGGIVRRGLGYDWSDVAVMTNIGEDHIGQDGIESISDLINIKALVAERVRPGGSLVLNADDENSMTILTRPRIKASPKKIVYFSLNEKNPRLREHLSAGGTAYFPQNEFIVEGCGQDIFPVVKIVEIPITLGGTAEFQVANAMAAVAACREIGISREHCAAGLRSFRSDADNPGRNNLYKVGTGYVLVDYGHNTDGFAAVCRMARRWTGKTVTGIIGLPGDRDDRIVQEAAQVAARGFDRVIVTEEVNRRGREVGEMAKLLCDAIEREKPGGNCEIVLDEIEAFSKALAEMRKNEVIVIFYRQLDLILEILARHQAVPVSSFEETDEIN